MKNLEDDVIPYVVVPDGDVNGDNEVDMSDALLVLKAAAKDCGTRIYTAGAFRRVRR